MISACSINALKEQDAMMKEQDSRLSKQQSEIDKLKTMLKTLIEKLKLVSLKNNTMKKLLLLLLIAPILGFWADEQYAEGTATFPRWDRLLS